MTKATFSSAGASGVQRHRVRFPAITETWEGAQNAEPRPVKNLTPAQALTAAYVHVRGWFPKKIHSSTFCHVLIYCTEGAAPAAKDGKLYHLLPEYVEQVKEHPLVRAVRVLEAKGFVVATGYLQGETTHSIAMRHSKIDGMDGEAHAYRSGRWSIGYGRGGSGRA